MKNKVVLTPAQPFRQVQMPWRSVGMAVMNNTSYSLLIREGAQERPVFNRYDYLVPPGQHIVLPVISHEFGLALDSEYPGAPVYYQPCTVVFFGEGEIVPDFGAGGYRESVHVEHLIPLDDDATTTLDCRAARALFMSVRAEFTAPPPVPPAVWFVSYIDVYTATTPDGLFAPDAKRIRRISAPRLTASFEIVVPLAANYLRLHFVNPAMGGAEIAYNVDLALLDEVPDKQMIDPLDMVRPFEINITQNLPAPTNWAAIWVTPMPPDKKWLFKNAVVKNQRTGTANQIRLGISVDRGYGDVLVLYNFNPTGSGANYIVQPLDLVLPGSSTIKFWGHNGSGAATAIGWFAQFDEIDG